MSNYLAIATVTATLQRMLQTAVQNDVAGARVTTVRPDTSGGGVPEIGVNIYLYQANPNPAWRNADLRNRRPKGDLIKQAQAGLDLYYLLTFYGNEVELEPQRLLGSTVRTLVDQPIITANMIRETVNHPNFTYLQASTLADQIEQVAIVPSFLSTDDLSKIWSVFFQTPYMLSFACQGGAVLIEGDRPGGRGLPVQRRQFYTGSGQPVIERITLERVATEDDPNQPFDAQSRLSIRGQRLGAEVTPEQLQTEAQRAERFPDIPFYPSPRRWLPRIQIGDAKLTCQAINANEIRLRLAELPAAEQEQLRAGVQSLQVIYPLVRTYDELVSIQSGATPERTVSSNAVPFVLCPNLVGEAIASDMQQEGEQILVATVTVTVDVWVNSNQRVFLMLNQLQAEKPASYIFAAQRRSELTQSLTFIIREINAGEYLVRLQIDGAESLLNFDGTQYVGPGVRIQTP